LPIEPGILEAQLISQESNTILSLLLIMDIDLMIETIVIACSPSRN